MTQHYRTALATDPAIPSALTNHIDQQTAEAYAAGSISRTGVLVRVAFRKAQDPTVRSWYIEHAPWIILWPLLRRSWSMLLGLGIVLTCAILLALGSPPYRPDLPRIVPAWAQPIGQLWQTGAPHVPTALPVPPPATVLTQATTVVVMASPQDTPQQIAFLAHMAPVAAWVAGAVKRPGVTVPFLLAQWGDESGWNLNGSWRGGQYGMDNFAGIENGRGQLVNYGSVWAFGSAYASIVQDGQYNAVLAASSLRAAIAAMTASGWAQGGYDHGQGLVSAARLMRSVKVVAGP